MGLLAERLRPPVWRCSEGRVREWLVQVLGLACLWKAVLLTPPIPNFLTFKLLFLGIVYYIYIYNTIYAPTYSRIL